MTGTVPTGTGSRGLEGALAVLSWGSTNAVAFLASDASGWFASPANGLVAAIESTSGAEETLAALSRLAPSRVTVAGAVCAARASWAEVTRQVAGRRETCIVGTDEAPDGAAVRVVCVRAPFVPGTDLAAAPSWPSARPTVERYFDDLQNGRFREAAEHFSADTIYSHPPYGGGHERVLYRGRSALGNGFTNDRGETPVRQVVTGLWQHESRVFIEGVIEGIPDGGTFLSTAQIDPEGKIARYVAFYSATRLTSRATAH